MITIDSEVLNNYWRTVGDEQDTNKIRGNRHFDLLTDFLQKKIPHESKPEDYITCRYRKHKKWDLHFPYIDFALEYKTLPAKSISNNVNMRLEEALGASSDLKSKHQHYKLGYIAVFTVGQNINQKLLFKQVEYFIDAFDRVIEDGHYDAFLPLQTMGIDNHFELSEKYSVNSFINKITNSVDQKGKLFTKNTLTEFFHDLV